MTRGRRRSVSEIEVRSTTRSRTVTLLRLNPGRRPHGEPPSHPATREGARARREGPGIPLLGLDGRLVQVRGRDSPPLAGRRLLAIPPSSSRLQGGVGTGEGGSGNTLLPPLQHGDRPHRGATHACPPSPIGGGCRLDHSTHWRRPCSTRGSPSGALGTTQEGPMAEGDRSSVTEPGSPGGTLAGGGVRCGSVDPLDPMLHCCCRTPSIPLGFHLAMVLPRWSAPAREGRGNLPRRWGG